MDLEGRVAIVSGIGPGMGRALALACAAQGADIALAARRQEHLDHVAAEIRALGRRAVTVPTDITEPGDCARLAERTVAELGDAWKAEHSHRAVAARALGRRLAASHKL